MKLVRSWPAEIPEGRAHVVDNIEHFVMTDFDYRHLVELDDDVCLIEWDMAIDYARLEEFMRRASETPEKVRTAPYLLYEAKVLPGFPAAHWAQFKLGRTNRLEPVERGDPFCFRTGFGLVYLPGDLIARFTADLNRGHRPNQRKFTDMTFSYWHHRQKKLDAIPIEWDCEVVHLHYRGSHGSDPTNRNRPDRALAVPQ